MFGKPVVGCRAGGMTEVVGGWDYRLACGARRRTVSLEACLVRLIENAALRDRLAGQVLRKRYLESFTAIPTAKQVAEMLCHAADTASMGRRTDLPRTSETNPARPRSLTVKSRIDPVT